MSGPKITSDAYSGRTQVLIAEPSAEGHRLYYVRLLAERALERGCSVTLLTTELALAHENASLHLGVLAEQLTVLTRASLKLKDVRVAAQSLMADQTVIPDGDLHLRSLATAGWGGAGQLSVLVMRPSVPSGARGIRQLRTSIKRLLMVIAMRRRRVSVFALRSPLVRKGGILRWVPDPVSLEVTEDGTANVRKATSEHGNLLWVGVFGRITARKNLPLVVRAVRSQRRAVGLLIAGSVDDDVYAAVASQIEGLRRGGVPVVVLDPPISDEILDSALAYVDCVVAAHSNEGPSGIVAKAVAAGPRLVLAGARSLREDAKAVPERAEWVPLDEVQLSRAIARAITASKPEPSRVTHSTAFLDLLLPLPSRSDGRLTGESSLR